MVIKRMRTGKLFYFMALLFVLPMYGFSQRVPVAPSMLFNIGGSDGTIYGSNLKFDPQGNIYVTGSFTDGSSSIDFDPSAGITKLGLLSGGFVAKYTADSVLVWIKTYAGDASDLEIDSRGNLTIIGQRPRGFPNNHNRYTDAFVLHLDNNGNVLWERLVESGTRNIPIDPDRILIYLDYQKGNSIASDDAGNVLAVFTFGGSPDVGGVVKAEGSADALVVKYDPNGNVLWKLNFGSPESPNNSALQALVDKDNNLIVAGYTDGNINYNPLGTPVNVTADNTIYIAKYSPNGLLIWIKTINANMYNNHFKMALDLQDNIYITGSIRYPIDFGSGPPLISTGTQDVFIAKYSSAGNLLYHNIIGGVDATMLNTGIAIGPDNGLYLSGNFVGKVDVDHSPAVAQLDSEYKIAMYVAKYDSNGNYQWAFRVPGLTSGHEGIISLSYAGDLEKIGALDINVNGRDEIFVTGSFQWTVNFNGTGCGVNGLTSHDHVIYPTGSSDMFLVRYTPTLEKPITNNKITAPVPSDICPGTDPGLINGSIPVGENYTYQWQQSSNGRTYTNISGAVSRDFDPPEIPDTTYYRRRLVTNDCAVPNLSNVVMIALLRPASFNDITAPSLASFCNTGDAGVIRGTVAKAVGHVDYQWQHSTDSINFVNIDGARSIEYDPPPVNVTTYYRRLITNLPCNMGTPSNMVTISVTPAAIPTISPDQTLCIGYEVTLKATGGIQYDWSPAEGLSASNIASPIAKPTTTTTYRVNVFNGTCNTLLTVKVIVVNKPLVNAGLDQEIMNGDKVQLDAKVDAEDGATYKWTPATYLDNPNIANPIANPTEDITYLLTVSSPNGCFDVSDEVAITVREKLKVPNSFTPNGDGVNDLLNITGLDSYKKCALTIFGRNGAQVFKSIGYAKPWDGTHNGKPLPVGTYYYIMELNNSDRKRLSGYIYLIK